MKIVREGEREGERYETLLRQVRRERRNLNYSCINWGILLVAIVGRT